MTADNQPPAGSANIPSPCIGVCVLDGDNICQGCFRNTDEIGRWTQLTQAEQREVIALSWQRARNSGKVF